MLYLVHNNSAKCRRNILSASLYGPRADGRTDLCRAPGCDRPKSKRRAMCESCFYKYYVVEGKRNRKGSDRNSDGHKWCFGCKRWLAEESFHSDKSRPDGLHVRCRRCDSISYKARTYGLSKTQLFELLQKQDMKCALCLNTLEDRWCVDHDHSCCSGTKSCGKCVRGVLCLMCNSGLGMFNDDPELLRRAAAYV